MAGYYPDYPSWRIPWHKDGTSVFALSAAGVATEITSTEYSDRNRETLEDPPNASWHVYDTTVAGTSSYVVWIFPRKMDIDGTYLHIRGDFTGVTDMRARIYTSTDTTNGVDGTWTYRGTQPTHNTAGNNSGMIPQYRTDIQTAGWVGVKGLRLTAASGDRVGRINQVHLFGSPTAGEDTTLVQFWHPTLDQRVGAAYFDWGDVLRSTSTDKTFRIKNLSTTQVANDVAVSFSAGTNATPSTPSQYTVSDDGTNFSASVVIPGIAADTISGVLTVRRTTPANAQISLWSLSINAEPDSWT